MQTDVDSSLEGSEGVLWLFAQGTSPVTSNEDAMVILLFPLDVDLTLAENVVVCVELRLFVEQVTVIGYELRNSARGRKEAASDVLRILVFAELSSEGREIE